MDETKMNQEIEELIAGYILDDLTEAEIKTLEDLIQSQPELQDEINLMRSSFELMPLGLEQLIPPQDLETKILEKFPHKKLHLLPTIAVILCLGLIGLLVQNLQLRQQLKLANASLDERVAEILQRPKTRLVKLEGEGGVAGNLMFTPGQWQEVIVAMGNLPPLPADQVYRMWLQLANGEVLYCGEFRTNDRNQVYVRLLPPITPPKGVKATGVFVTLDSITSPLSPEGKKVAGGQIKG